MPTLTGVDVLVRSGFTALRGLRVGLITNHTGLTGDHRATVDVLHGAPDVKLAVLFSPEHGIRGAIDERVRDSVDEKTGLPVYSLYGETYRPKPEQLQGLDALVYDIQDIGCRFYTYISTLGYAVEAAAEHKLKLVVLDRPNPITGAVFEGPMGDPDRLSFTAYHPMPVRHGLTVGELASLFNGEKRLGANLTVMKCEGWKRRDWFDATGLTWTNPSPNMRSLTEATLYPGIGLLETTNLSVGRGTDAPFEVVGAPWLDGVALAQALNGIGLPGVRFISIRFTPKSSVNRDLLCGGVNILITQRSAFQPLHTGIEMAVMLRRLYPKEWRADLYDRLLINRTVLEAFLKGATADELAALWRPGTDAFGQIRRRYLLYG